MRKFTSIAALGAGATQPRAPITRAQLRLVLALQAAALVGALALLAFCPQRTLEAMGLIATAWVLTMALFVDARTGRLGPPAKLND